jgi:hypothetical protein
MLDFSQDVLIMTAWYSSKPSSIPAGLFEIEMTGCKN